MSGSNTISKPLLLDKNYFLIGFMGTGKSHWGKLWAAANKLTFVDLDELIENAEKTTIAEIFDTKGEDYFRNLEKEVLRKCGELENTLIACGGGTPCFYDNMQWMNDHGVTIFIRSRSVEIFDRVMEEKDKRPLLKKLNEGELLFYIEQKLKEREPFYSQAQIKVESDSLNENSFAEIASAIHQ
jgi:shikimate kinase